MKETDLAWAAGLIDGEGCITIQRGKSNHRRSMWYMAALIVTMTHRDTVEKLHHLFNGGEVYFSKPSSPRHRPRWTWRINGGFALETIKSILPYLVTKASVASVVLKFGDMEVTHYNRGGVPGELNGKREQLFEQVGLLNKRGVA